MLNLNYMWLSDVQCTGHKDPVHLASNKIHPYSGKHLNTFISDKNLISPFIVEFMQIK